MTDLTRLPISDAAWCALVDHAVSLGDLSEIGYLELKGTLPFGTRAQRKKSAVTIARAVLGIANRMPDVAERHLGGHGVVLVGVAKNAVTVAEEVDPADLSNLLEQYLGTDGPGWEPRFIQHPDGLVLAVVVYPPKWGDPPHACRKKFTGEDGKLAVNDGDLFVRRSGKTEKATSAEQADLLRRFTSAPAVGAEVNVTYAGKFTCVDKPGLEQDINEQIASARDSYIASIRPPPAPKGPQHGTGSPGTLLAALLSEEGRTEKMYLLDGGRRNDYKADVERWHREAVDEIPTALVEVVRHYGARGYWRIANLSQQFLEDVQVKVELPPGVLVLSLDDSLVDGDVDQFNIFDVLPNSPGEWDSWRMRSNILMPGLDYVPRFQSVYTPRTFDVEATAEGGTRITWHLGTLRPDTSEEGDTEFVLATLDGSQADVHATWRVTVRGVHHVFTGPLTVECNTDPGPSVDL